jgi:hypothetical protein
MENNKYYIVGTVGRRPIIIVENKPNKSSESLTIQPTEKSIQKSTK